MAIMSLCPPRPTHPRLPPSLHPHHLANTNASTHTQTLPPLLAHSLTHSPAILKVHFRNGARCSSRTLKHTSTRWTYLKRVSATLSNSSLTANLDLTCASSSACATSLTPLTQSLTPTPTTTHSPTTRSHLR